MLAYLLPLLARIANGKLQTVEELPAVSRADGSVSVAVLGEVVRQGHRRQAQYSDDPLHDAHA